MKNFKQSQRQNCNRTCEIFDYRCEQQGKLPAYGYKYKNGQMAMAHNGNLVNAAKIREKLEEEGIIFQSTIDSEVILNLISRFRLTSNNIEEAIVKVMKEIKGAYSLLFSHQTSLLVSETLTYKTALHRPYR